jgi:energy-coupling factor transport system substrate-specific component
VYVTRLGTLTLALVPLAIAVNVVVGQLTALLRLPLYLDSIGTVMVGALAGPLAGALTGALSNVLWGLLMAPTALPFAVTAAVIGALAGLFARAGAFRRFPLVVGAGALTGVVAAIVSAPIAAYLFGGVTGGGTDALVAFFQSVGANILQATLGQGLVSDPVDKAITYTLVWLALRALPTRQLLRFPQGEAVRPKR